MLAPLNTTYKLFEIEPIAIFDERFYILTINIHKHLI